MEAGVGQVNLARRVDPDPMRRRGYVAPAADLAPIPVKYEHMADAAQDVTDRAILAWVAHASIDPSPRVDADIGDRAADRYLGPILYHLVLIVPKPYALRHRAPP